MRVATWNLKFGQGTPAWRSLRGDIVADLWFLQETKHPDVGGAVLWESTQGKSWGSAVVCGRGEIDPIAISGYSGWVVGGRYVVDEADGGAPLFAFSVHAPTAPKGETQSDYVADVRSIVSLIIATVPAEAALLIGGDFNFLSLGPRATGEELQTTPKEWQALQEFRARDLIPLWPAVHPGAPLPQTLRWTRNKVTPFHCDGFLLTSALAIGGTCEVLASEAIYLASDHNPVVATIGGYALASSDRTLPK